MSVIVKIKCDRCGKERDDKGLFHEVTLGGLMYADMPASGRKAHLCGSCTSAFDAWCAAFSATAT